MRNEGARNLAFRILPVADRVEEEILARARESAGAALGLGLLTLRDLERRLLAAARLAPIDPLAAELIAAEVAPSAGRDTCFEGVCAEAGFARAFLSIWSGLRDGGCGLPELRRICGRVSGLTAKRLRGIERIASAYEAALEERGLVDAAGARLALLDRLQRLELPPDLARASVVQIEDVIGLSIARIRMLEGLARRGLHVVFRVPALEGRAGLAASLEALIAPLEAEAPHVRIEAKAYGGGDLSAFHARLFDPDAPPAQDAPVEIVEGDDPRAELRAVVAAVRRRLRDGAAPDDVWIAARGIAGMREAIGAALDEAKIPWRDRRGLPALEAPPVAVALAVLAAAERGFPREELGQLLLSRYVAGGVEDEAGWIPPREILRLLREAASRDDRGEGHAARLASLAARLRAQDDRRAAIAERAARWLGGLLDRLRMEERATLVAHAQRFAGALDALGLYARSRAAEESEGGNEAIDRAAARAVARDQAALRALSAAIGAVAGAARRARLADREVPIARFRDLLEAALAQASLPPRGARGGAVRLVDVEELPGRRVRHLVLCGVVDGRFPAGRMDEPLLDESDREAIAVAAGRRIFRWRSAEEPLLFALATMAAEASLTVTASRHDADGREAVRSPFFAEALDAAGREEPTRERAAIAPPAIACVSAAQLRTRAALLAAGAAPAPDDPPKEAVFAAADPGDALRLARAGYGGEAGGTIDDADALAWIDRRLRRGAEAFGPNVAWTTSVSALEAYATCPFRYFAGRMLSLPEPESDADDLDRREGGSLLHEVAADVFAALRDRGLLPLAGGTRAEVEKEVAFAAAEEALQRWERTRRTGPLPLWSLRRAEALHAIARLLESEVQRGSGLVPSEFEAAFGEEGAAPLLLPSPDGAEAIAVRGRIDRVDRSPDGAQVAVIDYKSGAVDDRVRAAELGRSSFQLPIYAAWARKHSGAASVDAFLVSLRDGSRSRSLLDCADKVPITSLLELDPERRAIARGCAALEPAAGAEALPDDGDPNLADAAWAFLLAMRRGRFDVAPYGGPGKACRHCAWATVCRVGGDA